MNILIVGTGSIGKRHLMNFVTLGVRKITVVDLRQDRIDEANRIANETYESLPAIDKKEELAISSATTSEEAYKTFGPFDVTAITMPPKWHLEEVEKAYRNKSAIYCEKPLCKDEIDLEETLDLINRVNDSGLLNMVTYNYRFWPQLIRFRELIRGGVIGNVISIRGNFSECVRDWHPWEGLDFYMSSKEQGGGALLDETHLIDLCRWVFGDIVEVAAYNGTFSSLKDEIIFETDDLVEFIARFESGVIGSFHMDLYGRHHQKTVEAVGEEGTAYWIFDNADIEANRIEIWKGNRGVIGPDHKRRLPDTIYTSDWNVRNKMYLDEAQYILDSHAAGRSLRDDVPDLRDGLKTIAVARAIRSSAKSKRFESVERLDK